MIITRAPAAVTAAAANKPARLAPMIKTSRCPEVIMGSTGYSGKRNRSDNRVKPLPG
jgi:hypothetical protein